MLLIKDCKRLGGAEARTDRPGSVLPCTWGRMGYLQFTRGMVLDEMFELGQHYIL